LHLLLRVAISIHLVVLEILLKCELDVTIFVACVFDLKGFGKRSNKEEEDFPPICNSRRLRKGMKYEYNVLNIGK
jgi:hypothetical protein